MEHRQTQHPRGILSDEDTEFLRSIRRDYEKSSWIKASGLICLLIGIGIGVTPYIADASDNYLLVGIFFACIGVLTMRDISRTTRLYEILRKLTPSNMDLPR